MTSHTQMSMFDDDAVVVKKDKTPISDLTWSYSRRTTFEQCLLKYYFQYYASHRYKARAEQDKRIIRFLKDTQPRFLYGGDILHQAIRSYFNVSNQWHTQSPDRLIDWAIDRVQKDRQYSRDFDEETEPIENRTALMEYFYGMPDAELLYDEIEERLKEALRTFLESPEFDELRQMGLSQDAFVEKKFYLKNLLPCQITGQVDLAYRVDGKIVIIDWKFGGEDNIGQDSLQLATYSLWALDEFKCSVDDISLFKAYLGSNQIKEFRLSEQNLENARVRIIQDAERMAMYHSYGMEARGDAFSPCLQQEICKLCPFQRFCYD